jgi:hypothetical protein
MTRMGPESLLIAAQLGATAHGRELPEYARLEYSLAEAPRIAARLLDEFEAMPSAGDGTRGFFRRAFKLFRREGAEPGIGPGAQSADIAGSSAGISQWPSLSKGGLAALPAMRAGIQRGGAVSPMSAIPTLRRV